MAIPEKYIGKKIEVLMFDLEEVSPDIPTSKLKLKPSQLKGFLSESAAEAMQKNSQQSRNEWDIL